MQKILLSAYSCGPNRGSEPGVGWNAAVAMAKHAEIHILTSFEFKEQIEALIANNQMPANLFIHFFDLPFAKFWWKHPQFIQLHYHLWQLLAGKTVRKLHKQHNFDSAQHITFVRYWSPSCLRNSGIPYIFGPVAGADLPPKTLIKEGSFKRKLTEVARKIIRFVGEHDFAVKATLRKANYVLAGTPYTMERCIELGVSKDKIAICPGIALSKEDIATLNNIPINPTPSFFCLGRLAFLKGYSLAIKALAKAENNGQCELTLIGDGPERASLEALANELGVKLRITGFIPRDQALKEISNASILLHPSYLDSGSCAIQEAMAAGRPIICLKLGGPECLVSDETGFRIEPKSPDFIVDKMAEAIAQLLSSPEKIQTMGKAAQDSISNYHSWEAKAKYYISLHNQISNNN